MMEILAPKMIFAKAENAQAVRIPANAKIIMNA